MALEATKEGGALEHISDLLFGTSAKTSLPHATGFANFLEWLDAHPVCSTAESPDRLVVLIHYLKHFNSKTRLAEKGVQSSNGVAKRTVLRRATTDIGFANDFMGIFNPWPVHSPQVKMLCKSHFKRAAKGAVKRVPFKYSPDDCIRMARSVERHSSPFIRHILRLELFKILACLRTDDSIYIDLADFSINLQEGVVTCSTGKTKSTEQTSGRLVGGMDFRLPLLPGLGPVWFQGFVRDAQACGLRAGGGFIIPKDERAFKHGLPVHIAQSRDAVRHLRTALRVAGFSPKTYKAISEHTGKRTASAAIRRYKGPEKLDTEEYGHWLHHRPTGPFQSVAAYNSDNLIVPAQKVHVILEEWLATASPVKDPSPPAWHWGRLELAIGPTPLRYHVLVSPEDRQRIFEFLVLRNTTKPLSVTVHSGTWVPLCAFLRRGRFERPDGSTSNRLVFKAPAQGSLKCDVCMSRGARTLWKKCE